MQNVHDAVLQNIILANKDLLSDNLENRASAQRKQNLKENS